MTEHKGLPVAGYVGQTDDKVAIVNRHKVLEEQCLRACEAIMDNSAFDADMAARAFREMQQAFMWLNRAVFQPTRIKLEGDE